MFKLMIVDDEPVILNGLKHMITKENSLFTEVEGYIDSVEALKRIDDFRPDLLITDIQMPELDGLELVREAHRKHVKRFVILTGYNMFEYAQQAIRLNVAEYLLKPIRRDDLAALLTRFGSELIEERKLAAFLKDDVVEKENLENMNSNIMKFEEFVHANYTRDLSLDEVASHLQLHPNYVCNLLKKETGETFIHYLHTLRIEKAKDLLLHAASIPMEQVARNVGYENPRHFYKVFKQYEGQTPGSFRNQDAHK